MSTSLRGLQVCVSVNLTVTATLPASQVFPCGRGRSAGAAASTMIAVPAVEPLTPVSPAQAAEIALAHYGLAGSAQRLESEHDDTFRLAGADGVDRLLKISAAP